MNVSVIIPTFKRPESAMNALNSLQGQKLPEFEMIVVDNAVDAGLESAVALFNETARVPALYLPEPRLGLHYARHAGAAAAAGEILVYTDDDAVFDADWLLELGKPYADPAVACVGGKVVPEFEAEPPDWVKKHFIGGGLSILDLGDEVIELDNPGIYGVNFSIRKQDLYDAKGFNPDSFGDTWLGDGETGLLTKVLKRGRKIIYNPQAVVTHIIPPGRTTQAYMNRRMSNQGACESYAGYRERGRPGAALLKTALREAVISVKERLRALAFQILGRESWHVHRAQASYWLSRSRYDVRLAFSGKAREMVLRDDWLS